MFTSELRARPVLLIVLLAVAAAGAGLFAMQRLRHSGTSSSAPAAATVAARPHAPAAAKPHRPTAHRPVAQRPTAHHAAPAPHRAVKPKHVKPAAPATPADRLPVGIKRAFAADRVVVVALYDPKAKIDNSAVAEAREGARRADTSFVAVDVRKNGVTALNTLYGVIQDPAVLVLRPSGELVFRSDGFADRDTVAQAAANASS